jgi:hypothetical protein
MSKKTLATGTSPFAHLLSGFRGNKAEDEKHEDDEARKARRAEEDEKRNQEDARRAEEDDRRKNEDARRAEEDGADPEDKKDPEGSRADDGDDDQDPEADAGDDDDTKDMDDKEAKAFRRGLALGRARENARAARIFANPAAAGRADFAATLAFTTRNTSAEASRLLGAAGATPTPRTRALSDAMAVRKDPRPGADGGSAKEPSFGERVAAAVKKSGAR